jgi:thiol-disulfide isomerase/thioredoxin
MIQLRSLTYRQLAVTAVSVTVMAAVACGSDDTLSTGATAPSDSAPDQTAVPVSKFNRSGPALDAVGIADWINSEPISIQETLDDNKVVLVDFWTYTCVNCLRTLPFLQDWYRKYSDHGLVIIGVHSPEFEFEKVLANVQQAVEQDGVVWPVALDSDMRTWQAFGNRFWPAKYLLTPSEGLVYSHFGEGQYVETEEEIRAALEEAGWDVSDIPVGTVNNIDRDPFADGITRELYGGYERNYHPQGIYAGDEEYYIAPDATRIYVDDGSYEPQQFFLHGEWTNGPEAIIHSRTTEEPTDYIALLMESRSANVVIQPQSPEPFRVYATLDDLPLTPEEAGNDILFDDDGNTYFVVDEARLYRVVQQPSFKTRLFKLSSNSNGFAVFAYTFGVYDSGF